MLNSKEKDNNITPSPDFEKSLGEFDLSVLDKYDELLAAVKRISGGSMKVVLSLHNANHLGINVDHYCDVYCTYLKDNGKQWYDFYTDGEMRKRLKERYRQALWNELSEVILAVNLENEPMVGDDKVEHNLGDWVCDIATFLKNDCNLKSIAVATGGIRGAEYYGQKQNWPDEVFTCQSIDIITFHAYFGSGNVDQPWYDLFLQGSDPRQRAIDSKKLLMVEELSYSRRKDDNFVHQNSDIWAQTHALNVRGIPWLYWDIRSGPDGYCDDDGCKEVSVDGGDGSPWSVLKSQIKEGQELGMPDFDWFPYFTDL